MRGSPTATSDYTDLLYKRLQRNGALYRDCQRMVNQDRNVFAACMVAEGDADAMVTGVTRSFATTLEEIRRVIDPRPGQHPVRPLDRHRPRPHGVPGRHRGARAAHRPRSSPTSPSQTAAKARRIGHEPRVALLSFSNFGNPPLGAHASASARRSTCSTARKVDFEYDGEMQADVALDFELMRQLYPFCRLTGAGQRAGDAGPPQRHHLGQAAAAAGRRHGDRPDPLRASPKPAQIVQTGATVSDIVTAAALAALDAKV